MAGCLVPLSRWFYQGQVAPNAKIYVYASQTTGLVTVYADGDLSAPIANPVPCDANGEAVFYVGASTPLRLYVTTSAGALIRDIDPVIPVAGYDVAVTAGTASPNAALILGASRNIDYLDVTELKGNGAPFLSPPGGRLTLTSNTPVTTSDVLAATTLYYSPYNGPAVPINSTFGGWMLKSLSQVSLPLDSNAADTGYHQSGKNFDVFAFLSGESTKGAGTLRIGTGPAWTGDAARGTGAGTTELQQVNGLWVNKNAITLRYGTGSNTSSVSAQKATYLGTFRATADGQTDDSEAKRFVWNAFNRVARQMAALEATDSWNYSTAAFRQANASTANQLDYVCGLPSDAVEAAAYGHATNSTSTARNTYIGIGVDSTTVNSARVKIQAQATNVGVSLPSAFYRGNPGIGRHFLTWLEYGAGADTQTWYGDSGGALLQSGIIGTVAA